MKLFLSRCLVPDYISILHCYHREESDLHAIIAADDIKVSLEREILDDGDSVDIIQTIPLDVDPIASASIIQLRRSRNILIRTRTKENYDLARAIDQAAHTLAWRLDPENELVHYDWSKFMQVCTEVMQGKNPLNY